MPYFYDVKQFKTEWENELETQIYKEDRSIESRADSFYVPLILVSFSSKSFTDSIIQRQNYTRYNPRPPICDKCSLEGQTFALCPKIENYWSELFKTLSEVVNIYTKPDPILTVLGLSELNSALKRRQQQILTYRLITAIPLMYCKKKV